MNIKSRPKVSVAMATYNGEKFIKQQIKSILCQLMTYDELIISDDGSSDKTIDIINKFNDKRIKIYNGPKDGINKNFENAITHTTGEYIFLSDQDDIWEKEKIDIVLEYFKKNKNIALIRHNAIIIDENNNVLSDDLFSEKKITNQSSKLIRTFITNNYQGCAMAFRSELKEKIIPIPKDIYLYDLWIGLVAIIDYKTLFIKDKLIRYRRYGNNNSEYPDLTLYPHPHLHQRNTSL